MSRPMRILRNAAMALAALILVLAIAAVLVVQSAWFAELREADHR